MAFDNPNNGSFSAAQIKIAGNYVELELARILRDTIGNGWNTRQMSLITVQGSKQLEEELGVEVPTVLVSEMESDLTKYFGVTLPVVRKDIRELIEDGLFEKVFVPGSKKNKTLRMTADGYASWREYNERRAAVFVAAGKTIEKLGGTPSTWAQTIRAIIKRFYKGGCAAFLGASLFTAATALSSTQAQAWEYDGGRSANIQLDPRDFEVAYMPMPLSDEVWGEWFAAQDGVDGRVPVSAGISYEADMSSVIYKAVVLGSFDQGTMIQTVDAASFLDKHLPKDMAMNGQQLGYQHDPVVDHSMYAAGELPITLQAIWQNGFELSTMIQTVDAASFLDKHLPKDMAVNLRQQFGFQIGSMIAHDAYSAEMQPAIYQAGSYESG